MSGDHAQARAREAAERWIIANEAKGTRKMQWVLELLTEAFMAGHEQGEARYEPAWREMSENLEWVQKSGKALTSIHPRCLGMNLAAVASDLVAAAYPSLRGFIGRDGADVRVPDPANPAEVLRTIAERMGADAGLEVDHPAFDEAAEYLDEPVDSNVTPLRRGKPEASNVREISDPSAFGAIAHLAGLATPSSGKPVGPNQAALLNNAIGLIVQKRSGDYEFDGEIRAVIIKRSGEVRYAVEDDRGLLLVMNARQCGLVDPPPLRAPWNTDGISDLSAFRITTGDPRFDPLATVSINGYLYRPATES